MGLRTVEGVALDEASVPVVLSADAQYFRSVAMLELLLVAHRDLLRDLLRLDDDESAKVLRRRRSSSSSRRSTGRPRPPPRRRRPDTRGRSGGDAIGTGDSASRALDAAGCC